MYPHSEGTTKQLCKEAFLKDVTECRTHVPNEADQEVLKARALEITEQLGDYLAVKWQLKVMALLNIERARTVMKASKALKEEVYGGHLGVVEAEDPPPVTDPEDDHSLDPYCAEGLAGGALCSREPSHEGEHRYSGRDVDDVNGGRAREGEVIDAEVPEDNLDGVF